MLSFSIKPCGEAAMVVEFGETIEPAINDAVIALMNAVDALNLMGVYETLPTFRSLLISYEPLTLSRAQLVGIVEQLVRSLELGARTSRLIDLPICYDAHFAPDLDLVADHCVMTSAQVIEAHAAAEYKVYMLGFLPGQPYLGVLAPPFDVPRRKSPRPYVAPGSVGLAMKMTSIFPLGTPCGWQIIGRCPTPVWDGAVALCQPGDRVRFSPVTLDCFESLSRTLQ
jgi:inhibitor of KinA